MVLRGYQDILIRALGNSKGKLWITANVIGEQEGAYIVSKGRK